MIGMVKSSRDPQAMMNMLVQQNPQMGQYMRDADNSGMSRKEYFYQTMRQRGIDPDAIVAAFN